MDGSGRDHRHDRPMSSHDRIAALAAVNGGVVSRRQLVRAGVDAADVDELRRRTALGVIRRGWYETPGADAAVVAAVRAGATVACVSALKHRPGVWIPPHQKRLHTRWSRYRGRPKFDHQCRAHRTLATPITAVDALPEALICAANCLDPDMFVAVADSVLRLTPTVDLADIRQWFDGAPVRTLRLLGHLDPAAESGTESVVRYRLRRAHIGVRTQVVIPGVGRVDLLVGDRLIIECDSDGHHNGARRKAECRRDRTSTVGNYRVLRIDYDEVMDDQEWAAFLQEVLALARKGRHRGTTDF